MNPWRSTCLCFRLQGLKLRATPMPASLGFKGTLVRASVDRSQCPLLPRCCCWSCDRSLTHGDRRGVCVGISVATLSVLSCRFLLCGGCGPSCSCFPPSTKVKTETDTLKTQPLAHAQGTTFCTPVSVGCDDSEILVETTIEAVGSDISSGRIRPAVFQTH